MDSLFEANTAARRRNGARIIKGLLCVGILLGVVTIATGQSPQTALLAQADAAPDQTESPTTTTTPPAERVVKNPESYKLWVLAPALLAIGLAIFTRQVVPALFLGVIAGAYMLVPCQPRGAPFENLHPVISGFRLAMETYVIGAITNPDDGFFRIKIMVFTLVIGFMVGVIGRNGGTQGMVKLIAGSSESPRRTGLTAWLAGMVVFFDDYANTMIVGPTMRSIFDKVKLSRAKLAYIVDSTAAPVASLALIGTWVGAEIGYINDGIKQATENGVPAFLATEQGGVMTGLDLFIKSLPYRFYPILALFFVFLIAWTRRDFGPMKKAEARAAAGETTPDDAVTVSSLSGDEPQPRWWLGLVPVLMLVAVTIVVLIVTGYAKGDGQAIWASQIPMWEKCLGIIENADPYLSIYYGAILSAITAILLTLVSRACSIRDAVDSGLECMARMLPAIVILILAWALSEIEQKLMLGNIVGGYLDARQFPAVWAPLAIFVAAAGTSFAMGTSWGTMGILCPITVGVVAKLVGDMDPAQASTLLYASVGSVLAGSIFGDHCSPISDTTVLSSVASGCRHEEHVWTQIPYALVTALAAMGLGDVLCSVYHQPWYFGLGAGAIFLTLVVLIFGRRPRVLTLPPPEPTPLPLHRWQASDSSDA